MMHSIHTAQDYQWNRGTEIALFDDCERCLDLASDPAELSDGHLHRLADLAARRQAGELQLRDLTGAEAQAIAVLRRWARTVFASGITEEVAR